MTDGAGRTATAVANVTIGTGTGDTGVPTVAITAPATGATVSGTSVSVSASASDNVGVVGVQFKLDGANLGAEDTTAPHEFTWNTTGGGERDAHADRGGARRGGEHDDVGAGHGDGRERRQGTGGSQNVVWTSPVNVTVNGNSITKTGGCNAASTRARARSRRSARAMAPVEFTMSRGRPP